MRFTWVALPVLLATLTPSGGGAATEETADDEQSRPPVVRVAAESDPVPARPWIVVDREFAQPSQGSGRRHLQVEAIARDPSVDGASSESADVHLRVMRVASLDFSTRISHSLSGFLPSYSTACPPPAA